MSSRQSSNDEHFMQVAMELARRGEGYVEPNPMVGCVIVRDNEIIGKGYHGRFGGPHAEIAALDSIHADPAGATAYVTLEPCCHHGKTPPCSNALIQAGIQRVVVALADPFAKVDGGGLKQLSDAGIEITVGPLSDQASDLLAPYLKVVRTAQPWVIAKWAMTVDGRIATTAGESQWITSDQSRQHVHALRGRVDAIAVGMGTVAADDPSLSARPPGPRTATRVVFCRHRLPDLNTQLVRTAKEIPVTLIVSQTLPESQLAPLIEKGLQIVRCQTDDPVAMINAALTQLGSAGMTNIMVEGGGELLASFMLADQIDECHVYLGAKLFGGSQAPGPIGGMGIERLADAKPLELQRFDSFGNDVRMIYRREHRK